MKKKIRLLTSLMLILAIVFGVVACGGSDDKADDATSSGEEVKDVDEAADEAVENDGETVKLGAYLQLTGGISQYGNECNDVIQMAVEEMNAEGGWNGKQIEYIVYDTQGSAEEAVKVVTKMMEVDDVDIVIGSVNSNEVMAAAGKLNDAGIFNLGLGTSSSWMKEDWPYVFRASFNNDFAAPTLIKITEDLGMESIAIMYGQDDSSYSNGMTMIEEWEKAGFDVVAKETLDTGDVDLSAQIRNILDADPDGIYSVLTADVQPIFVKQLRQAGYNGMFFNKDPFVKANQDIVGEEASNYIVSVVPYVTYSDIEHCDIPVMCEFLEKFQDRFGELPGTEGAYRAWDTMNIIKLATEIAGSTDSDALKEAMPQITDYEGLAGTFDYSIGDREGSHAMKPFVLIDGVFQTFDGWVESGGYDAYREETGYEF